VADLYALLGLSSDVGTDRLRHTYEQHVSAAVRSHDHRRAVTLSAAFDALPPERRHQLYPRLTTRAALATAPGSRRTARRRRGRPNTTGTQRSAQISVRRVLACLVAPIVVSGLVVVVARRTSHTVLDAAPPPPAPAAAAPTTTDNTTAARHDAELLVAALSQCRKMARGRLPSKAVVTAGGASFGCGTVTVTANLQEGATLQYARTSPETYRFVVTANGETVRYNSTTRAFS
jgi:hypothetical protein